MFTIIDVLQLTLSLAGIVCGFMTGYGYFGVPGAVGGAVIGFVVGFVAGRLPLLLALTVFQRKSTHELWQVFEKDEYYVFHLALADLMARGEDVSSQKPRILDLMASENGERRRFGWASLQIAFPELAAQLENYNPKSPSASHHELIQHMRSA